MSRLKCLVLVSRLKVLSHCLVSMSLTGVLFLSAVVYPNLFFELTETLYDRLDLELTVAVSRMLGYYHHTVRARITRRRGPGPFGC